MSLLCLCCMGTAGEGRRHSDGEGVCVQQLTVLVRILQAPRLVPVNRDRS